MLDQLERFNRSLHDRIEAASDLSVRNAQLAAARTSCCPPWNRSRARARVAALGQVAANVATRRARR
jgi:hypothetical protein